MVGGGDDEGVRPPRRKRAEVTPASSTTTTRPADARPHALHGTVRWERGTLIVDVGRRSAANKAARPAVSLLYPVRTDDDYSLIVDGTAAVLG